MKGEGGKKGRGGEMGGPGAAPDGPGAGSSTCSLLEDITSEKKLGKKSCSLLWKDRGRNDEPRGVKGGKKT